MREDYAADAANQRGVQPAEGEASLQGSDKLDLIQAYKAVLREALEARPSGIRLRIARTIGKNKSFISQITNPKYKTPLPEKYVEPILEVLRFTPAERERFLEVYRRAHPRVRQQQPGPRERAGTRMLSIELPKLKSRALERQVDLLITEFARKIAELVERR